MIKSSFDGTKRLYFKEGYSSVIIPTANEKYAVCVSCQIGCPIGCKFCYSGKTKLKRNLTSEEIVNQVKKAAFVMGRKPYSVVFMGMGEPLMNLEEVLLSAEEIHNFFSVAYKRITISTSAQKNIDKLLNMRFNVSISLHSPFHKKRKNLIPSTLSVKKIVEFSRKYCRLNKKRELMIEYALIKGVNDSEKDLKKLLSFNWPKKTNFNFIEFNNFGKYKKSEKLTEFKNAAIKAGFKSFIRYSRGADIKAACGMLSINH